MLIFSTNFTIITLALCLFTCEAQSEEEEFEGNNTKLEQRNNFTWGGRHTRSLNGLYTALGILDLVGGGLRLGAEIVNLVGAIGSVLQLLSPQQQLAASMQEQLLQQQQQLQEMQEMQAQNMQDQQEMQSQACTAKFSYYASNGYPVYECDCPSGTSYQYLRCVNPDESVNPDVMSDVQNTPDMQQQNVQDQVVQEQPCTATFSYHASDGRPVYHCDCPGYGISYQYNRCISPKYARD
ncbi:unnamed protein product [Cylicocyclus nassatus]|uniref:Uncharacterized protein n=1 Tax=Cylicocyclus nassatus TaxID=53992 RepID=A0AA36M6L5_CYLNA|nr:unnamed protein product [Cylicocyclus nassatus]